MGWNLFPVQRTPNNTVWWFGNPAFSSPVESWYGKYLIIYKVLWKFGIHPRWCRVSSINSHKIFMEVSWGTPWGFNVKGHVIIFEKTLPREKIVRNCFEGVISFFVFMKTFQHQETSLANDFCTYYIFTTCWGGVFLSSMCFVSVQFHQVSIGSNVAIVLMSLAWTKSLAAPLERETCGSRGGDDMTNSYRPW